MSWLELASPALLQHLNSWSRARGVRKSASVDTFEECVATMPSDFLAIISVSDARECVFSFIGNKISVLFPGCESGMKLSDVSPLPVRLGMLRPIQEVLVSRQPLSRRSTYQKVDAESFYEQLILPFVDKNFNVRRLAVVADGYTLRKMAA